jgi:DNA primase
MLHDNCGLAAAVEKLKKFVGYQGEIAQHKKIEATKFARKFAKKRGYRDEARAPPIIPENHMLIYENHSDKLAIWEAEGISKVSMAKFQIRYDALSNRLVYPVRNSDGQIINVAGRTLDENWKEKGQRKYTYYFKAGRLDTIYGLFENRDEIFNKEEIILFEGAKSVMLADTWGIYNTAALLTSHLSQFQMKALLQLGCRAVFALDKDINVRIDENIKNLTRYIPVEYLYDKDNLLEEKMSPVDAGRDTYLKLYSEKRKLRIDV